MLTNTITTPKIYGIRHHGPGSARSLLNAFEEDQPDIILVEGPPDANHMLHWLDHEDMEPPLALVVYRPDQPKRANYFPFAVFSPEYQAVRYALKRKIPVRFMDLPQAHFLATTTQFEGPDMTAMTQLANAAGFASHEAWWNYLIEQRRNDDGLFDGILTMMTTVRELVETDNEIIAPKDLADSPQDRAEPPEAVTQLAEQREAYMRQMMRQAEAEGFRRVAVVCGAWHAPALTDLTTAYVDEVVLQDMPHTPVEMAWVPWTYDRLASFMGYGAGIKSPGWYHHLWEMGQQQASPTDSSIYWLRQVADLLRQDNVDVSAAHIIEAVRLAESLAALRDRSIPGLLELNESTQTVICFGEAAPLQRIQAKLIVGQRMGTVPTDSPMVPLQRDLIAQQRRLQLFPEPDRSTRMLDMRNELHLTQSQFLHRLKLLGLQWGKPISTKSHPGTYREVWHLQWQPADTLRIIEANIWGNTVEVAATAYAQHLAQQADNVATLTQLLDAVILADLPEAVTDVMTQIESQVALSSDIPRLMEALPPLANVLRYGSVRKIDTRIMQQIVDGLIRRICLGLPHTCASMADDAAADMHDRIVQVQTVVTTLQNKAHRQLWQEILVALLKQPSLHGLVAGRVCRILLDSRVFTASEATSHLERALSIQTMATASVQDLMQATFWLEGFLRDSGLVLVHDEVLWKLLDQWLVQLQSEQFMHVLPLLRRTFSSFSDGVRQQLNQRIENLALNSSDEVNSQPTFDSAQADLVLPLVAQLLGLKL